MNLIDHPFDDGGFGDDECNAIIDADCNAVNRCGKPESDHERASS